MNNFPFVQCVTLRTVYNAWNAWEIQEDFEMVERREWALPQTVVQRFQPNEYVAACWVGTCDTKGFVYYNETWGSPDSQHSSKYVKDYHVPCNQEHEWKTDNDSKPAQNAYVAFSTSMGTNNIYYHDGHLISDLKKNGNHS